MDRESRRSPTLRHLEVFHWVMVTGTLTGAARVMNTSQPAVSRDLAQLQRLLGHRLFERDGRRLRPSAEAAYIHSELRRNYLCADMLLELSARVLDGTAGHLSVASVPSLALTIVPDAIHETTTADAKCTFDLQVHSRDSIADFLRDNQFDVAFTVLGAEGKGLSTTYLTTAEAVCVCHPSSPLARLAEVTPQDLADQPFISLAPSYMSRQKVDEVFLRAGVSPKVFMTTQTAISACGVIRRGYGVSVLDPFTAVASAGTGLCVRPFTPSACFDYVVAVPARQRNAALVDAFIGRVSAAIASAKVSLSRLIVMAGSGPGLA
jgi:DNA-binding transcriptional LysR family regulator